MKAILASEQAGSNRSVLICPAEKKAVLNLLVPMLETLEAEKTVATGDMLVVLMILPLGKELDCKLQVQ